MSAQRTAYLVLERLLIEAETSNDPFADVLRDSMMPFWEALAAHERAALQARTGTDADELNPTVIRDAGGTVSENRPLVAYLVLERILMDCERAGDPFASDVRDGLIPFWEAVTPADCAALQTRTGSSTEEVNPTIIEELATHVVALVPWLVGGSIISLLDLERSSAPAVTTTLEPALPRLSIDRPYGKAAA